ncbi:MAG: hypothetical protein V4722_10480 [Bacteroidota bacterium]
MKIISILILSGFFLCAASAQPISILDGWKFKMGDDVAQWKDPGFDDSGWAPVDLKKNWNNLGYEDQVGFGWYRKWFDLPGSFKEKSFLKG